MGAPRAEMPDLRAAFGRLVESVRPKLHRYCARMTGSVIDGEDVVQEALLKAMEAYPRMPFIEVGTGPFGMGRTGRDASMALSRAITSVSWGPWT